MDTREWAKLQESLLKTQLKVVREFLRKGEEPRFIPRKKRKSQMHIIYDILLSAQKPLHVTDSTFGIQLLEQKHSSKTLF